MIIKILMFPIILLLILYFAIAQVVPTYESIQLGKAKKIELEKDLQDANDRADQIDAFVQSVRSHASEKEFVLDFVPNDQKEEILINDIVQIAENSDIDLFSIGFADGGNTKKVSGHTANLIEGRLIVSGTYNGFQKFFDQMFRLDRLYAFKTIDLVKPDKKEDAEGGEVQSEQMLNGTVTFAYGYAPGRIAVDPAVFSSDINYKLIGTVMQAVAPTNPLVAEPQNRENPFLP